MTVRHFYSSIFGYFDFADVYGDAIGRAGHRPRFVEVGVGLGKSLAWLAVECVTAGNDAEILAVDVFTGTPMDGVWPRLDGREQLAAVERALSPVRPACNLALISAPSVDAARTIDDETCNLVFIDAAHDYASVAADLRAWWPKVKRGGVFAGHDYPPEFGFEVAKAVDEWAAEVGVHVEVWRNSWRVVKGAA